jgi:hypothetical protein
MIETVRKRQRRASELVEIWHSYFPALAIGIEFWMVNLDDFPFDVLASAIKQTARKQVQLNGQMTLQQMTSYIKGSCYASRRSSANRRLAA